MVKLTVNFLSSKVINQNKFEYPIDTICLNIANHLIKAYSWSEIYCLLYECVYSKLNSLIGCMILPAWFGPILDVKTCDTHH